MTRRIACISLPFLPLERWRRRQARTGCGWPDDQPFALWTEGGHGPVIHAANAAAAQAGVRIHRYPAPYVLHTKFVLSDPGTPGAVGVVGSSNMDIRSFSLNYESSLLVASGGLIDALEQLGANYLAVSRELTLERWSRRPWYRWYVDNVMKLTSALQ